MIRLLRSRILIFALLILSAAVIAIGCGSKTESKEGKTVKKDTTTAQGSSTEDSSGSKDDEVSQRANKYKNAPTEKLDPNKKYVVELDTDKGKIKINVDQKAGPIAAANFVFLVKDGFYDGVKFHRIIKDFMIQTGDPTGTGQGGPGYSIKDDKVTGKYDRGVVAMANAGPNTGGSQFFIVQGDSVQLGPDYAIFGKVSDPASLDTVDKIAGVEVKSSDSGEPSSPVEPVRIISAKLL